MGVARGEEGRWWAGGQDKKVQTDYQRRKQLVFQEMLQTLRNKERASSSEEVQPHPSPHAPAQP